MSEWQQHLSQQKSAVAHPQEQFSHGKRPIFSGLGAKKGNPIMLHDSTANSRALMNWRSGRNRGR